MSVIRVHKNKNFTVMSNVHLRDMDLSLKAKGLLSVMLSLPDNWNYSIAGLCSICKENETAIKSTIKELKERRYVIVDKKYPNQTESKKYEYVYHIFEEPQPENQEVEKQGVENLPLDNLPIENHALNKRTDIPSTDKSNTDEVNTKGLNTEKEDKTLSNDNVEVKTSFSENRKKMSPPKTALEKYLGKKADEQNMMKRLANICMLSYDDETAKEIFETIEHYFRRYTEKTGLIHPILTDKTLKRITEKMDCFYDSEYSHFERLIGQDHAFMKMADMFFDGDFGANNGNETNYHLPAFMTDGVLNPLGQRLFELGEVM